LDTSYLYPFDKFNKAWQLVCLNQFHDIIPGSSIEPVYEESLRQYDEVRQIAEDVRDQALGVIAAQLGDSQLVVNPTSFTRNEIIVIEGETVEVGEVPPYSISTLNVGTLNVGHANVITCNEHLLENEFIRVEFNPAGDITRIYDKMVGREVLADGAIANQFQAFEDRPLSWDAWDIDIFYDDKMWLTEPATSIEVVESNNLRATLEIKRKILGSDYAQRISLNCNSARLDFETTVNWNERRVLLKVAFPVDVLSPTATYEIQWGNVERPSHRNTSWDWARFETAAQKWVDLSEGGYGVSLLNDCKYGHDIHENVIRLTLLRGTTAPDPMADYGEHHFTYSLLPHPERWGIDTVREAYALNDPLFYSESQVAGGKSQASDLPSLVAIDRPNIIIETIKRAENGNGIIVRMYEYQRQRGSFTLATAFPLAAAWKANLLEEDQESIPVEGNQLQYSIKPYQILTLRLIPA
jgi:alpha-mannosidase